MVAMLTGPSRFERTCQCVCVCVCVGGGGGGGEGVVGGGGGGGGGGKAPTGETNPPQEEPQRHRQ